MQVQVLGTGCSKCKKLFENATAAIQQSGVEAELLKIEDLGEIMKFKVMSTPALAVDGKVRCAGRVPEVREIVTWLTEMASETNCCP